MKCRCGKEINSGNEPQIIIENGKEVVICSDCYFDAFGEEIEKYPIADPGMIARVAHKN